MNENQSGGGDDGHGCPEMRSVREEVVRSMGRAVLGCHEVHSRVDRDVRKMVDVDQLDRELVGY